MTKASSTKAICAGKFSAAIALACLVVMSFPVNQSLARQASVSVDVNGDGHGVGMSQYGAYGMAKEAKKSYQEILAHYYTGTNIGQVPDQPIRVLMRSARKIGFSGATGANGIGLDPKRSYFVVAKGSKRLVLRDQQNHQLGSFTIPLQVISSNPIKLHGRAGNGISNGIYRGTFEFRPDQFIGINAINVVDLEDYVRGVVGGEVSEDWPSEALKAQAVATRSFAVASKKGMANFDHYPDTRSQMYLGIKGEHKLINAAVNSTKLQVVTYKGRPVTTYFFSSSGGQTENIENVWIGSTPQPWLKAVDDPYDRTSPKIDKFSRQQLQAKLGSLVKGAFQRVEVVKHGVSPRIISADVVGSKGITRVTGSQLAVALGASSTWITFNEN